MITKSDWESAYRRLIEEGRQSAAPPPTVEEVEALFRGELPEEESERLRERLAYYPEMVRAMTAPFPAEATDITEEEQANGIAAIRRHLGIAPPAPPPRRLISFRALAIAAGIVVVIGIAGLPMMRRWWSGPRMVTARVLHADGERGGVIPHRGGSSNQTPIQFSTATDYDVKLVANPQRAYREYRVELLDLSTSPPKSVWSREVHRAVDDSYALAFSTEDLEPGRYRLALYGVDGEPERIASYTIRVSRP